MSDASGRAALVRTSEGSRLATLVRWIAPVAPARRWALVRAAVLLFGCGWLLAVAPDLLARARLDPARFAPVGLAHATGLVPPWTVGVVLAVTLAAGVAAVVARERGSTPTFAMGLLWLLSYRNSWGHLSHVEHLLELHAIVVAMGPVVGLARRGAPEPPPHERYGWPLRLMMLVTVSTYAIAGLAKVQQGGLSWLQGESVRLHVAHEVLRMRLVGTDAGALGRWLLPHAWPFLVMAAWTLAAELGAPLALLAGRVRVAWIATTWAMHLGIGLVMGIVFPYPLAGIAFAPFIELERGEAWLRDHWRRRSTRG